MSQESGRGAAEELSGAPETSEEHNRPASPSSTPGGDSRARGASEDDAHAPHTE
jgi:hypothetical protein